MSTLIREAKYIKADFNKNNNKFWYIKGFDDSSIITEWGRVGKTSQSKTKDFPSHNMFVDDDMEDYQRTIVDIGVSPNPFVYHLPAAETHTYQAS